MDNTSTISEWIPVGVLTKYLKAKFDRDPHLQQVAITGEISNFRKRNGHQYFVIKDDDAQINAVMWANIFNELNFELSDGLKVNIIGRVGLYEKQGNYSINITKIIPDGIGELFEEYRQRITKLKKEGIFDLPKKKIPLLSKKIAVITSPSGAVLHDILTTVQRRNKNISLSIYPSAVQGNDVAPQIIKQLKRADENNFDVIILARGGGSFEDLFVFNDVNLVKTISELSTPIISSIGHETDTTIVDLVADKRAPTPTAAAEFVSVELVNIQNQLSSLHLRLNQRIESIINQNKRLLNKISQSIIYQKPTQLFDTKKMQLDLMNKRFMEIIEKNIDSKKVKLLNQKNSLLNDFQFKLGKIRSNHDVLKTRFEAYSPLAVLNRGYAIVSDKNSQPITDSTKINKSDLVEIQLAKGKMSAIVQATEKNGKK